MLKINRIQRYCI